MCEKAKREALEEQGGETPEDAVAKGSSGVLLGM